MRFNTILSGLSAILCLAIPSAAVRLGPNDRTDAFTRVLSLNITSNVAGFHRGDMVYWVLTYHVEGWSDGKHHLVGGLADDQMGSQTFSKTYPDWSDYSNSAVEADIHGTFTARFNRPGNKVDTINLVMRWHEIFEQHKATIDDHGENIARFDDYTINGQKDYNFRFDYAPA